MSSMAKAGRSGRLPASFSTTTSINHGRAAARPCFFLGRRCASRIGTEAQTVALSRHDRVERVSPAKGTIRTVRTRGGRDMNWDQIEGNWTKAKGKLRQQWGKLTDDDITVINGKREELAGRLQERYGYQKDQAEKEIDDWMKRAS